MSDGQGVTVRTFQPEDLGGVVAFWNRAFADQPNFRPTTADEFGRRVLACPRFEPEGFFLAWEVESGTLVGLAHALRPPRPDSPETAWVRPEDAHHFLALLHVDPAFRRQGIGSRLLQAAERWLYYCPVHVGDGWVSCYGRGAGVFPPLFGPAGVPAIGLDQRETYNFLAHRGYLSTGLGDVTLVGRAGSALRDGVQSQPGLTLQEMGPPHAGGREGENLGQEEWPLAGFVLLSEDGQTAAQVAWTKLGQDRWAVVDWTVEAAWRGKGLGGDLLDRALVRMAAQMPDAQVEIRVDLNRQRRAADMLKRRGFVVDAAWVNLVKT